MSNFRDMVNANIQSEKEIKEKELALLEKEALKIASYIRNRILEVAKEHKSKEIFHYEGILYTRAPRILNYSTDKHIVKYGLFVHKSESIYSYSLTEDAKFFYKVLKKELQDDGIDISEWQIGRSACVDEYSTTCSSFYLYDKTELVWGPYLFDSVLKEEYNDKWTTNTTATPQTTKHLLHYKNKTYTYELNTGYNGIVACIIIKFSNK